MDREVSDLLVEIKQDADNDLILSKAMRNSAAKVVLGYFFHMAEEGLGYRIDGQEIQGQMRRIANSKYPLVIYSDKTLMADPFITAYAPEGNLDVLSEAATASGYFNMLPDPDGTVRWMPLIIKCGDEIFAPLSVQTLWQYLGRPQLMSGWPRTG